MSLMHWKDSELLSNSSLERLSKFADLIMLWNSKINLTGYRQRWQVEEELVGESVLAAAALQRAGMFSLGGNVLDFGSGAGIPGLVWAMLDLPIQVTSLEVRQKKAAFQKEVARELNLKCSIVSGLFPDAAALGEFDLIVSRAIRFDPGIWKAGEPCLSPIGSFVRFAVAEAKEHGWRTIPASERTSLLVRTLSQHS